MDCYYLVFTYTSLHPPRSSGNVVPVPPVPFSPVTFSGAGCLLSVPGSFSFLNKYFYHIFSIIIRSTAIPFCCCCSLLLSTYVIRCWYLFDVYSENVSLILLTIVFASRRIISTRLFDYPLSYLCIEFAPASSHYFLVSLFCLMNGC